MIELGKGISEWGMMAIAAAAYILISYSVITAFLRWFAKVINNIIDRQQRILDEILELQKEILFKVKN